MQSAGSKVEAVEAAEAEGRRRISISIAAHSVSFASLPRLASNSVDDLERPIFHPP